MSLQFSQFGAGNPKPRHESSIGVEIEKMNVDHELEKVEVARHVFDEMPKVYFGVGHTVFDEFPNGKVNPTSGSWFRELNGLKQISSVKEYHETFCSILDGSQVSLEYGLSCFIDGLKEEIQGWQRCNLIQLKDVGEAEKDNNIENMVFEYVKEEKDIVAQVVIDSPNNFVSVLAGVEQYQTTKVTGYFERNKQDMLWDTFEMQDLCPSLAVKKESEDGRNNLSLLAEIKSIEGMEKTSIEMLNKHKRMGKSSNVMIFAENFEWKPGLEFWLVEKGRKNHYGLNEHGVTDTVRNVSLMIVVKVHPKYGIQSFEWQYLGRKYIGSRRLQGDVQHHFRLENTKFYKVTDMMWDELQFETIKKVDLILPCHILLKKLGYENTESVKTNLTGIQMEDNILMAGGMAKCRVGAKWDCEGQTFDVVCYVKLVNLCYNVDTRGVVKGLKTGAHQAMFYKNIGSADNCFQEIIKVLFGLNLLKLKKDWEATGIGISLPIVQGVEEKLNVCHLFNCDENSEEIENKNLIYSRSMKSLKEFHVEVQLKGISQIEYADFLKSQQELILKIKSEKVATYFLEEWVMKNRLQVVDKWLVKWKWKKVCGKKREILTIGTNSLDPWGQGSFERGVLLCVYFEFSVIYVIFVSPRRYFCDVLDTPAIPQAQRPPLDVNVAVNKNRQQHDSSSHGSGQCINPAVEDVNNGDACKDNYSFGDGFNMENDPIQGLCISFCPRHQQSRDMLEMGNALSYGKLMWPSQDNSNTSLPLLEILRYQLQLLLKSGVKFEIEALHVT
ncbi:hypothetical protein Tco_1568844 [Tanacetum coccineum]